MLELEMPFNWAQVRAYVEGVSFPYGEAKFRSTRNDDFDCLLAIPTLAEMKSIRNWLQEQIENPYEKLGLFEVVEDARRCINAKCVGVRFVFQNALDCDYFRLSCHSGHPVMFC